MTKKIHFIVNPASGQPYPILHIINAVCSEYHCDWSLAVTKKGNTKQIAQAAAQSDADVVVVYGGDGTIAEVAGEIYQTDKCLGVLPGGTANVFSMELGISKDIRRACELICSNRSITKSIDIGKVCNEFFLLRVGIGFEAELVKGADRTAKTRMGWFAYLLSGLQATFKTKQTKYRMILDGEPIECKGLSLIIANSGNLGVAGISLFPEIRVTDGKLDVLLVRAADLNLFFAEDEHSKQNNRALSLLKHWQAQKIVIETGHKQAVQYDGEVLEQEQLSIEVLPQALKVIQ